MSCGTFHFMNIFPSRNSGQVKKKNPSQQTFVREYITATIEHKIYNTIISSEYKQYE